MTSFPLARQNGRTIDRASTDERVSPSQTSANNVQKQCPRRQIGRLERAGRHRTGHRRFRRHTVSETGGFPPHTDGQGCEGLFSHLPAVHRCRPCGGVTFFPSAHPCCCLLLLSPASALVFPARPSPDGSPVPSTAAAVAPERRARARTPTSDKMSADDASTAFRRWPVAAVSAAAARHRGLQARTARPRLGAGSRLFRFFTRKPDNFVSGGPLSRTSRPSPVLVLIFFHSRRTPN